MPWPDDHKTRTREKIVQAAAAAFRAGGVANVRLEDVMARAGLTHGGFYAHFSSKEELLREAVKHAGDQTLEKLSKPLSEALDDGRLQAVIDAYLSPGHVAHPEWGCPLATLGPEIVRTGGATHGVLADGVRDRLAWMRGLASTKQQKTDDQIIGALACMIGGVILARAVGGKDAAAVLDACREFLRDNTGRSSKPVHGPRRRRRRATGASRASR
jgi:TetR/AcrR family transcriptional repressor of nem operon